MGSGDRSMNGQLNGPKVPFVLLHRHPEASELAKSLSSSSRKRISLKDIPVQQDDMWIDNDSDEENQIHQRHPHRPSRRLAHGTIAPGPSPGKPPKRAPINEVQQIHHSKPEQLREYYKMCMNMISEKKISGETAFELGPIDRLAQLIQAQPSTSGEDYKLVSSALDISTAVYIKRVDHVHDEAKRCAFGMMQTVDHRYENHDPVGSIMEALDDSCKTQRKKYKQNQDRKARIAEKIESLNLKKVDSLVEVDPLLLTLTASLEKGGCNSSLMSNLVMSADGLLSIDHKSQAKSFCGNARQHPSSLPIANFSDIFDELYHEKSNLLICKPIADFTFQEREKTRLNFDDACNELENGNCPPDLGPVYPFNNASERNQIIYENPEDARPDDYLNPVSPSGFEAAEPFNDALNSDFEQNVNQDLIKDNGSLNLLEGSDHLEEHPLIQNLPVTRPKRERRKKEFSMIDFHFDSPCPNPPPKRKLKRLEVATLNNWKKRLQDTIPDEDDAPNLASLEHSFNKPDSSYNSLFSSLVSADTYQEGLENLDPNHISDSANLMSPLALDYSVDCDDDASETQYDCRSDPSATPRHTPSKTVPFSNPGVSDVNFEPTNLNIPYQRVAKKVDIRRLRKAIWETLVAPDNGSVPASPFTSKEKPEEKPKHMGCKRIDFSQVYEALPKKISPLMSANLSVPIAFVTLLNIANEKNLKLIGSDDLSDFQIEQIIPEEDLPLQSFERSQADRMDTNGLQIIQ